ncbi:MAG: minor capsid protein [Eubacterium sp.]|nr:minor capsid protein [Eubacterium sp.]
MKSSEYWKKRFEELENASNAYGIATYRRIEPAFEQAQREIQKEIEAWYGRLAKNNSVSMQDARKLLSANELKEFHWDVNEYIKYGKENAINQQWMKELENASAKFHISRLEALKIRVQQAAEKAFGNELDYIDKMARKVYSDTYYHSIFEMQKGFNIGFEIGQIDERKLNKIIAKPWAADGRNFSDRIWQQKAQLVDELHTQLTRNCLLGKAPDDAIKTISNKFGVSKSQAGRLVMTEEAYFHSEAQREAFKELDVEEFEIVATLDNKTSDICREMDGKHFPISEYEPGRTAPPFHCWCRSVTVPYFDDDFGEIGERAARDADGKTYYVPADMTYKEWEKKYVVDATADADKAMYERYKGVLKELSPESLEDFVDIKYNNSDKWEQLKYQYRTLNQYKIDSGNLTAQEILDLDNRVITEKRNNFASGFKTSGNIAGAYIGNDKDNLILAHSNINDAVGKLKYKGEYTIIGLTDNRQFNYIDVLKDDGNLRLDTFYDTEAKLFEYLAKVYEENPFKEITILSERGMCDSCLGIMEQFKSKYKVTVNAVSNKKVEGNVWKHRYRKKLKN